MYTTLPAEEGFPAVTYNALAVAFLRGDDNKGWESIGNNGWEHYENDNLTIYTQSLPEHDNEGKGEIDVVFGELTNAEIKTVETKTTEEEAFEKAEIVMKKNNRYYIQIGRETIVRGVSESGEVIDRQGG